MKSCYVFESVLGALVIAAGCGSTDPQTTSTGGSPGMTGGRPVEATGGAGGLAATGGRMATGGATGTGGLSPTGGAGGGGGAAAGSGGTAGGGGHGAPSSGGQGGRGGSAQAGANGGNSNAGGASQQADVASSFDGALVTYPCGTGHSGFDCDNVGCSSGEVTHTKTFQLGGTSGTIYDLTFRVRGIVEAYNYVGGTRDAADASVNKDPNLFLRGGAAQAKNADGWDYDVYELDVTPAVASSPSTYFLNSVIKSENPHTSSVTQHLTFPLDYTVTIKVPAQGTLTLKQYDSNCKSVMNCGPTMGSTCANPRKITLDGSMPAPPASFVQPYQMPTGAYGQWIFFDVISAVPAK